MKFEETAIGGVWRVRLDPFNDERGSFSRIFCSDEFAGHGLPSVFEQISLSRSMRRGTLRGMHYQPEPHAEAKFIRCVKGAIFDVAVDLRPTSPTLGRWIGETLTADNGVALFIPRGLAHGFQTLEAETDVLYQITPPFRSGHGAGVRWNDAAFSIEWPIGDPILSGRDASYPDWQP